MSIIEGIGDIPKHIEAFFKGEAAAHPSLQQAISLIPNTIATLMKEIETKGFPVVKAGADTIAADIAQAGAGTVTKSAAGNAAITALKTTGTELLDDTLHILSTDGLTDVAGLITKAAG